MKHATFLAVCAAILMVVPMSDSEAQYSDAWVHAHCSSAIRGAKDNNKLTDIKSGSWKVEDAWYEAHRDPSESHRDPNGTGRRVDEWAQFRCSVVAQCPEKLWPHASVMVYIPADGNIFNGAPSNRMYYDDPRRKWVHTAFTGSVSEVWKIRCTEGGYLR